MKIAKPTFVVTLDTRRSKSDGTYPLKLRVTHNNIRRYYSIGVDLTEEQFEKLKSPKLRDEELKLIKGKIKGFEVKAETVFKEMTVFTFTDFEKRYFPKKEEPKKSDVYGILEDYIKKLHNEDRISTAESYTSTLRSLRSYKSKLSFEDVTPTFLTHYEKHMLSKGRTSTTVGIYLRSLRTIYNIAIDSGIIGKDSYPFRKNKFSIPAGRNIKKALTINEIEKIFNYETKGGSSENWSKDLWIFSYLCNGLNFKDIARLRYENIDGDRLTIHRAKTKLTTKSNQKPIVIYLTDHAKQIIQKWGNKPETPGTYIFNILHSQVSPERERKLVQQLIKLVNKYMSRIGKTLDISKPISTYSARHSFSTVLKRSGAPTEFISESLGHSSLSTTEAYLDSFEDDVKKQYASLLTSFDKKR
ncbi:site-specific integrase [Telluribacter humicola]|uniref:site-specific integrase n=1 Tax=Telluribacter humicola TaxID=1720261 RepID=UPI001A965B08|nr:site-specific integrase [Telluribacter humicola]